MKNLAFEFYLVCVPLQETESKVGKQNSVKQANV